MPLDAAGTLSTSRAASRRSDRQFMAWAAQTMTDLAGPDVAPDPQDGWTPARVGEAMIEALKWARYAAGRTGPAGYGGMRFPEAALTDELHAEMGWGLKESADDPADAPALILPPSPAQVTRHMAALGWAADYLLPDHQGSARMLGLWAACKAYRRPFAKAVDGRGISRGAAYQLRDKGLSIISQGLTQDQVIIPSNI